jgi:hypothetical protein
MPQCIAELPLIDFSGPQHHQRQRSLLIVRMRVRELQQCRTGPWIGSFPVRGRQRFKRRRRRGKARQ